MKTRWISPVVNLDRKGGAYQIVLQQFRRAIGVVIVQGNAKHKLGHLHYVLESMEEGANVSTAHHSINKWNPSHLAGNVGDMLVKRWRCVKKLPNLGQHATFCQHKKYPDTRILRQKSPTNCRYCSTYRYCNTYPQGWKNTEDKLNKSKLSEHM
jgi:hypothetical protein